MTLERDNLLPPSPRTMLAPRRTGGHALVDALIARGIDVVFSVPGIQLDPVFDALYLQRAHVRVVHTRHEQAAAYMADGYARVSGRIGCCMVVPGPGVLNATAGLATAYATSSPVLCIAGDLPVGERGRGRGVLHEIKDQLAVLRAVTKETIDVPAVDGIEDAIAKAAALALDGPSGPVGVQVPADVLAAEAGVSSAPGEGRPETPPAVDEAAVALVARGLAQARAPVIMAGGGVTSADASAELAAVAERLQAPVVMSRAARGCLSDRHPLAFNLLASRFLLRDADAVLVVGSRFFEGAELLRSQRRTLGDVPPAILQIDADPAAIGRNHPADAGVVGDARSVLALLAEALPHNLHRSRARGRDIAACKRETARLLSSFEPQASFGAAIRSALGEEGVVVSGMTQMGYWANLGFPVHRPRTFLSPGYQGTLGFEYSTALGAKVAAPDAPVVALVGDGGFLYGVGELATAVQHGIGCCAVVFNDNAFGNVLRIQREEYDGRTIASELVNPDFVALAESFGAEGIRCHSPAELGTALARVLADDRPTVIEVPVEAMPNVRAV